MKSEFWHHQNISNLFSAYNFHHLLENLILKFVVIWLIHIICFLYFWYLLLRFRKEFHFSFLPESPIINYQEIPKIVLLLHFWNTYLNFFHTRNISVRWYLSKTLTPSMFKIHLLWPASTSLSLWALNQMPLEFRSFF